MASNLFNQLNQQLPNNNILGLIKMFKETSNPQQMIMNMASQNPQVANILQDIKNYGGDAKSLFYDRAKQMGVDPDSILSQLR